MHETSDHPMPDYATGEINLASARLGAKAIAASDQFFAPLERMLQDGPATFAPNLYDDNRTMRLRHFGHELADDADSLAGNG